MASKKGKAAKGKARKSGGRRRMSGSSSMGGVSLFLVGAIITFGGVILAKLCKLPGWLSPVGAALWLYGWWKGNAFLRSLGLLYIGTGLAAIMGIPDAVSQSMDKLKAQGGIFNFIPTSTGNGGGGGGGGGTNFDLNNTVNVAADLTKALAPLFA